SNNRRSDCIATAACGCRANVWFVPSRSAVNGIYALPVPHNCHRTTTAAVSVQNPCQTFCRNNPTLVVYAVAAVKIHRHLMPCLHLGCTQLLWISCYGVLNTSSNAPPVTCCWIYLGIPCNQRLWQW